MPILPSSLLRFSCPPLFACAVLLSACARTSSTPSPAATIVSPGAATGDSAASPARARALLLRSLALLGLPARSADEGFEITLEARQLRGNPLQARHAGDSTPFPVPTTLRYLVDTRHARALFELRSPAPGDIWFHYLTRYDSTGAWQVDLLRWRVGDDVARGNAQAGAASLAAAVRFAPHALVRQALAADSPDGALRHVGTRTRGSRTVERITYSDPATHQPIELDIDPATSLPAFVATSGPGANVTEYLDWRTVGGLRVPYRRIIRVGEQAVTEQRVVRFDPRPALSESRFAMPAGYSDPPPSGAPRATLVAGAVHRLDGMPTGYHAAFVVGDSGVMVLEAPQHAAFGEAALKVIDATAPGRRITHVFVTHHHADHVGGLVPFVSRGATIVVGAGLEAAVRGQLPDSLRARARFETVEGRRTFGSGDARVEAIPVPNEHADGNVAYWVPSARVLFQGDLFYIPERGAVPPAFPVTDAMVRAVRASGLAPAFVVGVHGRTGSWAEVEESLRRARR